ncbi:polysaccharide export protein EpsE [Ramlibacter tataouinensis]|uniref:Sugar transporter n=1 Tax=Ramlibacter tataouinensis TaxID=94132 RepID=A0A127JZQ6_9BURK|nr:polysaccharide export protein EpsE [Ramlibacter tataouinensis]AMO25409.1 sugar transporter [Ramlibacter tataouinensis]
MNSVLRVATISAIALWVAVAPAQTSRNTANRDTANRDAAKTDAAKVDTARDYRLGPGDSIRVQVFQNPDLTLESRVSESGIINYPLVGRVNIGGLTLPEAEARIAQALRKNNILKSPQVNVNLLQVRGNQVSVLGQVQKPGRFPLETTNMRVSDVLAAAGGVASTGDDVLVITGTRNRKPFRKSVDIPALLAGKSGEDIVLASGDTLFVGKAPVFYIYGEAQRPGPYRVERGMTVMQAIAAGGGITSRGSQKRLQLTRTDAEGKMVQLTPGLTDPIQPGDVLFVRESIF